MSETVKIDQHILDMYNDVQRRKEQHEKTASLAKRSWKTTCSYPIGATYINIQTATTDQLRAVVGHLITQQRLDQEVGELIPELKVPVTRVGASSVDDWIEDINTRIAKMSHAVMAKTLADLESKLNAILPEAVKKELEVKAIQAQLNQISQHSQV
jgi:hypothetical protein